MLICEAEILKDVIQIIGKHVRLEEINASFFKYIIKWRNTKDFNRFLNQPFELNMELEEKWYRDYVIDETQGLLVMIDKDNNVPFGTIGWTDFDKNKHQCVWSRLLVGDMRYRGSIPFIEGLMLCMDYLYDSMEALIIYSHVVKENKASMKLQKRFGYEINCGKCEYPEHLRILEDTMVEIYCKKNTYEKARREIESIIKLAD